MNEIKIDDFSVLESIKLTDYKTSLILEDEDVLKKKLNKISKKLSKLQDKMYAHGKYSVLICLQGMDTAGKDSLIREVFKEFNVRGVDVHSFKVPTPHELKHDFLWRHYIALPSRGKFGIFNRTHYENVLVTKVHPEYILSENLPGIHSVGDIDASFWDSRYEQIRQFEAHMSQNGTKIFKFFLNLSKEEQKNRLLRRLNRPEKTWKFSPSDIKERKLWDAYQECYVQAINETSRPNAPWFVIPADHKPSARYIVASILYKSLKEIEDEFEVSVAATVKENIEFYKAALENE